MARSSVTRRTRPASGEAGSVLVVAVLLILALFALGHGLMLSSRSALLAAQAGARLVELRAAADGAIIEAGEVGYGGWMDSVAVWERGGETETESGDIVVASAWRRLGAEAWLLEASASDPGGFPVPSSRLVWAFGPVERVRELSGVVSVGSEAPVSVVGLLQADSMTVVTAPAESGSCAPWATRLEEVYPSGGTAATGFVDAPRLGPIDLEQLVAATPIVVVGTGTPAPLEALGTCAIDEAWNWGDPDEPSRPCGAHLALRRATGDLDVEGGTGQGILIVDGDLVLRAGARFYGFVIVAGKLRVLDGASLEGMAIAHGGVELGPDATIHGSACWAVRVLAAHRPTLGRPISLHSARRIGPN